MNSLTQGEMPKAKTTKKTKTASKKPTKKITKSKKTVSKRTRARKWNDQHRAVANLMEKELNGIIDYLQTIHKIAILLIVGSAGIALYSLRIIFATEQQAVIGFLTLIVFCIISIVMNIWVLRPWILPRFLLPLDLDQLETSDLTDLFKKPDEYLAVLKHHLQVLTESFLLPKLSRLRNSIILLVFGISISILLAIALP